MVQTRTSKGQESGLWLLDACQLGEVHCNDDDGYESATEAGIGNSSSVRRWNLVAKPYKPASDPKASPLQVKADMAWGDEMRAAGILFMIFGSLMWVPVTIFFTCLFLPLELLVFLILAIYGASRTVLPRTAWPPYRLPPSYRLLLYRYFSLKLITPHIATFHADQQYLFAGAPHAVFPFGDWLSTLLAPLGHIHGLGAPAVLDVPLLGNLLGCTGIIDCRKPNVRKVSQQTGRSLGVLPGGIAEIFENNQEIDVALIAKRKGFCKLAMELGIQLVPTYTLGATDTLHCLNGSFLQKVSASLRMSLTVFWGRWYLPVPFRRPIVCIVGTPIAVKKIDKPTKEQVDELHAKFLKGMHQIFEDHKEQFGWAHKELVFK